MKQRPSMQPSIVPHVLDLLSMLCPMKVSNAGVVCGENVVCQLRTSQTFKR